METLAPVVCYSISPLCFLDHSHGRKVPLPSTLHHHTPLCVVNKLNIKFHGIGWTGYMNVIKDTDGALHFHILPWKSEIISLLSLRIERLPLMPLNSKCICTNDEYNLALQLLLWHKYLKHFLLSYAIIRSAEMRFSSSYMLL